MAITKIPAAGFTGNNFRNIIINGDMSIDQRNNGSVYTPSNNDYILDRWKGYASQASKFTVQQSSTAPTYFSNSLLATSSSAYTVGASEQFLIAQSIEGLNVANLDWGTANAKTVTLSFWVRSSLTGTFGGAFGNNAGNRSYPFSYSISSADTWEKKSIVISGDTTGTWLKNNLTGIIIYWSLGSGASVSGTADAWSGTFYSSVTGATSVVGTSGATLYITGVQLEAGTTASDFEFLPYDVNLGRCQRYYFQYLSGTSKTVGIASYWTINSVDTIINFPVEMRSSPSLVATSGSSYYTVYVAGNGRAIDTGLSTNRTNLTSTQLFSVSATDTAGYAGLWTSTNSSASIAFNSEL